MKRKKREDEGGKTIEEQEAFNAAVKTEKREGLARQLRSKTQQEKQQLLA